MNEQWKTTAVIAAALVMIMAVAQFSDYTKARACYEAAAKGATVECSK